MATTAVHPAPSALVVCASPLALWHLLSLDAPTVAAVWTLFIARSFAVRLSPSVPVALALAVWLLYAGDRIKDARYGGILEDRHRFHLRHRKAFFAVMACVAPVLCELVLRLQQPLREMWLLLALPLLMYFVAVHGLRLPRVPKEAVVGIFFGVVTAAPLITLANISWQIVLPVMLLFAALCWLNGLAISHWELVSQSSTDPCARWSTQRLLLIAWSLMLGSAVLLAFPRCRAIALAVLLSASLVVVLDRCRYRFSRLHLRALADAALLTPLALWPFLPLLMRR